MTKRGLSAIDGLGAFAVRHAEVTATTYDAYGNYLVTLDTTDTGTVGRLRVQFAAAASCLPVWRDFDVLTQSAYDAIFGAAAVGYATPTNITGGTLTTVTALTNLPAVPANWLTAAGIATSALNGKGDWRLSSGYAAQKLRFELTKLQTGGLAAPYSSAFSIKAVLLDGSVITLLRGDAQITTSP